MIASKWVGFFARHFRWDYNPFTDVLTDLQSKEQPKTSSRH